MAAPKRFLCALVPLCVRVLLCAVAGATSARAGSWQTTLAPSGVEVRPVVHTPQITPHRWPMLYPTDATTPLGARVAGLLADAKVREAHWGIAVTAMDGTPIYGLDEAKLFRPASTAKLFTTVVAMTELGPQSTVNTIVSFGAPDSDGTVNGDVTLTGGGDANFGAHDVPWSPQGDPAAASNTAHTIPGIDELAAAVAARGVHHITGKIIAGSGPWDPYPQGWEADDLGTSYGAPVSMLSVHDNTVGLTVLEGRSPADPPTVTLFPDAGFLRVISALPTPEEDVPTHISVRHTPGESLVEVKGSLQAGKSFSTEFALDDPPATAAILLRNALLAGGITVDGGTEAPHPASRDVNFLHEARTPVPVGGMGGGSEPWNLPVITVVHTSPTLAQDVVATLKESLNLHAELTLRRLGQTPGLRLDRGNGLAVEGARLVHQRLLDAGIADHDFVLYDGSGLSTKDLVTPRAEAQLLALAAAQPWFPQWKAALPVGGVDGTLASRFTQSPLKGHVFAKTGTLGESRALAGYVRCASGREVIFAILDDNHEPGTSADRVTMDKLVEAIAELE